MTLQLVVTVFYITILPDFRFYVGCDFCQDWFHGTCVGITQAEADGMDEYKCPNCCRKGDEDLIELKILSSKELDGLKRLHRSLMVSDIKQVKSTF